MPSARYQILFLALAVIPSLRAASAPEDVPLVAFAGHPIRFAGRERPYYSGRTAMVSLRPVCAAMGALVKRSRDAVHWTILRGSDRLDVNVGERSFVFNGAMREMDQEAEGHRDMLFVPFDMIATLGGGALELNVDTTLHRIPEIQFRGRVLKFRREDTPVRMGGTVFVSLKATADFIGAMVSLSSDKSHMTIRRSLDRVDYDEGSRTYVFNGAQKNLRSSSILRGRTPFVPIELFQALVGDELRGR